MYDLKKESQNLYNFFGYFFIFEWRHKEPSTYNKGFDPNDSKELVLISVCSTHIFTNLVAASLILEAEHKLTVHGTELRLFGAKAFPPIHTNNIEHLTLQQ